MRAVRSATALPSRATASHKASSTLATVLASAPALRPRVAAWGPAQVTVLDNGITVVSEDGHGPVAAVSVMVVAGSRHEGPATAGAAHFIRALAYQSTQNRSGLWITRELEAAGASLCAVSDREFITYNCSFLRNDAAVVLENLSDAVTGQSFHPWELEQIAPRVQEEVQHACSKTSVFDALHEAAFRTGLGRPTVSATAHTLEPHTLKAYTQALFTGPRTAVIGYGVDHETLVARVRKNFAGVAGTAAAVTAGKYHGGGAVRIRADTPSVTMAMGFQGVALGDKDALALHVLGTVLGTGARVPNGHSQSKLAKALPACCHTHSFNFNYSDAGLFGCIVKGPAPEVAESVRKAVRVTREVLAGSFTADDVAVAKAIVRTTIAEQTAWQRSHAYGAQALSKAAVASPEDLLTRLDALTDTAVKTVAQRVAGSKPTFAAHGNVDYCPYPDEL